ncbi:MAG: TetR/AcrR family transcriptional regulator [Acidobacteriota bacterium]|nr:TetR/AcrR family transcriptional regulator [Acidobacteriota bacterium]
MPRKTSPKVRPPASSPRPRRKAPAPRAEQIVAAAFEEFSAHGFAATRLDDVARRAGVAKGTIYLHFKNKEILFQAVVRSLIRPLIEEFGGFARGSEGSAEDLLGQFLSRMYAEVVRSPEVRGILRLLIAESRNFPQVAEIYRREVIEPGLAAFRLVLDKGCASGEFRRTRARDFPQILIAPAIAAVVWMLVVGKRQPLDLDAYFSAHLEFVLRGLKASPRSPEAAGPRSDES